MVNLPQTAPGYCHGDPREEHLPGRNIRSPPWGRLVAPFHGADSLPVAWFYPQTSPKRVARSSRRKPFENPGALHPVCPTNHHIPRTSSGPPRTILFRVDGPDLARRR